MKPLRIGIDLEATGLPLRSGVAQAAKITAQGIQVDAAGDLNPDALGKTGRREFRNLLRSYSLELAALNVPLRHGIDEAENLQQRLDHIKKAMQLAFDLGARRVVVPCPKIPGEGEAVRAQLLRESLLALGTHGDRVGTFVALEIGYDSGEAVKQYLAGFDTGSLRVTYDTANLLVNGHDPLTNLAPLQGLIAHVHARDARSAGISRGLQEVPLGAGDIDWMAFTATLQVLEFDGFLTVDREQGQTKLKDVADGVKFLRRFAGPLG